MAETPTFLSAVQNGVKALTNLVSILSASFPQVVGTTTTATGGAATLPANPVGFVTITLQSGVSVKVPYYS